MTTEQKETLGILSILGSTFLYGAFGVFTRLIGYKIPLFYASFTRLLFAFLILFLILYSTKKIKPIKKEDYKWLILRSLAGIVSFVGYYVSFYVIPIGLAYFIFYAGSIISGYFFGKVLFKEKLTKIKIISLILALFGLGIVYLSNIKLNPSIYMLAALISGFGSAIWDSFSKKISGNYSATQLNMLDNFIDLPILMLISFLLKETWVLPAFNLTWLFNLIFSITFILTGQLMIYGFKYLDVQIASLFMLTEILFGIIFGFIFYKERITLTTLIGGIVIIVAIILPELKFKKLKS